MTNDVYLHAIDYALGESSHGHAQAPGFREVVVGKGLPELPDLWGWGDFHVAEDAYLLGQAAAEKTLRRAGIEPDEVTLTIFACSYFPHADDVLYQRTGGILKALGLKRSLIEGQTLTGCATLLSAVQNAAQLVRAGAHEHVLVIGIDKLPQGLDRFWDYGLFSDAAAACLVSSSPRGATLRLVDSARGIDLDEITGGVRFTAQNLLHVRVLRELLARVGCGVERVRKVFNNNVYLPIKSQKDLLAGFKRPQMFLDNVARVGHCLACDSLVNFADYEREHAPTPGETFLLQADGNGCCAMSLVEYARSPS